MKLTKWILTGVVAAGSCHNLMAGNFGAEYTTEWQTDFRQGVNWVNLLHLSYSSPTFLGMQLNAAPSASPRHGKKRSCMTCRLSQTLKKKTCLLP